MVRIGYRTRDVVARGIGIDRAQSNIALDLDRDSGKISYRAWLAFDLAQSGQIAEDIPCYRAYRQALKSIFKHTFDFQFLVEWLRVAWDIGRSLLSFKT